MEKLALAVIREEYVALTGELAAAVLLNQMVYWCERTKDTDAYLAEEKRRMGSDVELDPTSGWIYKTAKEAAAETMVGSERTMARAFQLLVERGWVLRRNNPKYAWDRTYQYRVDLVAISGDLGALGYAMPGYPLAEAGGSIGQAGKWNGQAGESNSQDGPAIPETTTETTTETTPELIVAIATPVSFMDWRRLLQEPNKAATLRRMFEALYPGYDPPDYGYLGKVARGVGGAGRLAQLLWETSTRPPTGDVLAYVQGIAKQGKAAKPADEAKGKAAIRAYRSEHGDGG